MSQELIKDVLFDKDCRGALLKGITTLSKAVKSTMGPFGKTCIIESPEHTHGITVTKDGYLTAKSINLSDPVENLGARILKQAAEQTASLAGDGSSTSVVLAEALILAGNERITEGINRTSVLRYMTEISEEVIEILKSRSVPCNDEILLSVAKISANNDEVIGKIIADIYKEVGSNGIVAVEKSLSTETYTDVTKGLKISRGYASPGFINNRERDECIYEDVHILVCDSEISHWQQIEHVLAPIIQEKKPLLIIAPCTANVVNTFVGNVAKNGLKFCIVPPPNFGYRQHELMEDIALSVGATYFSEKTGDDLSHITYDDLGKAKRIIVSRDKTVIKQGEGNEVAIAERIAELQKARELEKKKTEKDFINERIASLSGGIGVIYVGGLTDLQQKELIDRVEDSVLAVRSALDEGVVVGAGKSFYEVELTKTGSKEYEIAKEIILEAIKVPLIQILKNADLNYEEFYWVAPIGHGYDLKTGKSGNLIELGVINPLKVERIALQNAISVATTILSTDTSISIARA